SWSSPFRPADWVISWKKHLGAPLSRDCHTQHKLLSIPSVLMPLKRPAESNPLDDSLSIFVSVRPRLFGIAYRMLGSAAEAEDVVQDVWLWWQATDRNIVENPSAFLATTTTRICINFSQSAHSRRETYVGP